VKMDIYETDYVKIARNSPSSKPVAEVGHLVQSLFVVFLMPFMFHYFPHLYQY
jgi:hypothetical protein